MPTTRLGTKDDSTFEWTEIIFDQSGVGYAIPGLSNYVLTVDSNTDAVDQTAFMVSNAPASNLIKFFGGALVSDQYLVGVAYSFGSSFVLDVDTGDVTLIDTSSVCTASCWSSAAAAASGLVYAAPHSAPAVAIIDPVAGTVDLTSIAGLGSGSKYAGATVAADGRIFFGPWDSQDVMVVDPTDNSVSYIACPNQNGITPRSS